MYIIDRLSFADKSADKRKAHAAAAGAGNDPGDDPYYCGLRARVPNFAKNKESSLSLSTAARARTSAVHIQVQRSLAKRIIFHNVACLLVSCAGLLIADTSVLQIYLAPSVKLTKVDMATNDYCQATDVPLIL